MAKSQLKKREREVSLGSGDGKETEHTLTVDDNCLPSPEELEAYQRIDPKLIDFLLDTAKAEQKHRHETEKEKIRLLKRSDSRTFKVNWWGMFFAFLLLAMGFGFSSYLIYLDKSTIGTIFGGATLVTAASLFIPRKK